jgi:hypothetical protein
MVALSQNPALAGTNEWYVEAETGFNANPQLLINARADAARRQAVSGGASAALNYLGMGATTAGYGNAVAPGNAQSTIVYIIAGMGVFMLIIVFFLTGKKR